MDKQKKKSFHFIFIGFILGCLFWIIPGVLLLMLSISSDIAYNPQVSLTPMMKYTSVNLLPDENIALILLYDNQKSNKKEGKVIILTKKLEIIEKKEIPSEILTCKDLTIAITKDYSHLLIYNENKTAWFEWNQLELKFQFHKQKSSNFPYKSNNIHILRKIKRKQRGQALTLTFLNFQG